MEPSYIQCHASGQLKQKIAAARQAMAECTLCPRRCRVNRTDGETGVCRTGDRAWVSSMIGISAPNSRLKRFEEEIDEGQILMLIDVPKPRVDDITELVRSHHPEAHIEGTEPTIPPFP